NVVDKLVAGGLVERVPHGEDCRAVLARITPAGRSAARRATRLLNRERFGMDPLADDACEMLFAVLTPLRAGAGDYEPED
ncbi:MAG TPA: MarR family transcriptional regulator, partial [Solirubrobacteraceae bacterium]